MQRCWFHFLCWDCFRRSSNSCFPPTAADRWSLLGLTYDQWRDVQFGSLCLLALAVLVHVMMHWNWVCSVIATQILHTRQRPDEGMQTIYGVATLVSSCT